MLIGKRLSGRYKILEMIGGGGMANVYLAHDMILDRDVAVKILRLDFADDEEFIRRFHREAQSATSLAHPNIVNIFDVGEEDSIYYLVMEYVDGQTLKQYIQQQSPIPIQEALEIMQQLTSAISHAHQNHIIHRDIKPQNILIDYEKNVKITDFGIAMALSATSITQTNSVLGSVHYLSPEQARGGMANRKSDIYSLGIVMFELLTGRLPFSGESAVSIALKHLQSETPSLRRWNPDIPQSVENIVLKATAKDPFHRYDSVEEMEQDLRTALDPSRWDEEKFTVPVDDDATKAIPIITDDRTFDNLDETIVHGKDQSDDVAVKDSPGDQSITEKTQKKRKKWPAILISTFAILIILMILAVTVLPDLLVPKDIEVPDVTDYTLEEAKKKLQEDGFIIGETIEEPHEEIEEGAVFKTEPKAHSFVKEGSPVNLYVSTGKNKFVIENYVDMSYEDVFSQLEDLNFKDIRKKEVFHEEKAVGVILEQNLSEGDEVIPEEEILEFTVSMGPEPIRLKDLSGYNDKGLAEYADSSGLNIIILEEGQHHDTIQSGLVIEQNPPAGTQLQKGDKVTVTLSKGKKEVLVKHVQVEIDIPYEPIEEGMPQTVQILIEDMNNDITVPFDSFEITSPVTKIITLTIAEGTSGSYKVVRDDEAIIEEPVPYPEDE